MLDPNIVKVTRSRTKFGNESQFSGCLLDESWIFYRSVLHINLTDWEWLMYEQCAHIEFQSFSISIWSIHCMMCRVHGCYSVVKRDLNVKHNSLYTENKLKKRCKTMATFGILHMSADRSQVGNARLCQQWTLVGMEWWQYMAAHVWTSTAAASNIHEPCSQVPFLVPDATWRIDW